MPPSRCNSAMKCARRCSSRVRGFLEDFGTRRRRRPAPGLESGAGGSDRVACVLCSGINDATDVRVARRDGRDQIVQRRALAELDAARIRALRLKEIAGQADAGMPAFSAVPIMSAGRRSSVDDRHRLVGGEGDERGIGAVLQQAPHQIGQEIAMAADRRIGATGQIRMILSSVARTAPHPCRAGAEIRIRLSPPASSRTVATLSALWVANCGKMRGRSASSFCAQAM